jgi:hypothetical protein
MLSTLPIRTFAHATQVGKSVTVDYTILKQIGEGGMGTVYSASQPGLQRRVAIKTIRPETANDPEDRDQFLAEALVMGDLDHPNIIPIHELGKNTDGLLFYSMKQIRGVSWMEEMPRRTREENLDILLRVADAIAYAHSRAVIHCDLKPENVMLGEFGEVMVVDWGLAIVMRMTGGEAAPGRGTTPCGSPAYMAPELAMAEYEKVGPATDIYLLGATLYEILTGTAPHMNDDVRQSLRAAIRNEIPPLPLRDELGDIAIRAMATEIAGRFSTVQEFQSAIRAYRQHGVSLSLAKRAQDDLASAQSSGNYQAYSGAVHGYLEALELWPGNAEAAAGLKKSRHLYARHALARGDFDLAESLLDPEEPHQHEMIGEVRRARAERERRERTRRRMKTSAIVMTAVALVIILITYQWVVAQRSAAEYQNFIQTTRLAAQSVTSGDWAQVKELRAGLRGGQPGWEWEWLEAASTPDFTLKDSDGPPVRFIRVTPDGKKAGILRLDGLLEILEGKSVRHINLGAAVREFQWTNDDHIVTWDGRQIATINLTQPGEEPPAVLWEMKDASASAPTSLSRNGRQALQIENGRAVVTRLEPDGSQRRVVLAMPEGASPSDGVLSWDGHLVALIARPPGFVGIWDAATGKPRQKSGEHPGRLGDYLHTVQFSSDARFMVAASIDQGLIVFEVATMTPMGVVPLPAKPSAVAISADGSLAGGATSDGDLAIWNLSAGRYLLRARFPEGPVADMDFVGSSLLVADPQGRLFKLADFDGAAWRTLWKGEVPALDLLLDPRGGGIFFTDVSGVVRSLSFAADGAGINANSVSLIEAAAPRSGLGWLRSADGRPWLAVPSGATVKVLDLDTGKERVWPFPERIHQIASSRNGRWLAVAGGNKLEIFDAQGGGTSRRMANLPIRGISSIIWQADNRTLVVGGVDGNLLFVDTTDGQVKQTLPQPDTIHCMALSADGKLLAAGGRDRSVQIWDARSGKLLHRLDYHGHSVLGLAFSPDAKRLVSVSADGFAHVFDTQTGREIVSFRAHDGAAVNVLMTSDGSTLVTSGTDRKIRLWPGVRTPPAWR